MRGEGVGGGRRGCEIHPGERLAPLDIPDIPTSGMLEAPPSSSGMSGAAQDSGGLLCCWAHTGEPFGLYGNHIPANLGGHGNM